MKASVRNIRISPKKLNVIAFIVRNMKAKDALDTLRFMQKKGANIIYDVIKSAVHNAEHNDNQKIKDLHPLPFLKAIDISKNKKHLKYLIPPALVLVFIIIAAPNIIKESTKHYVQYDTHFERKAPFDFIVIFR